MLDTSQIKEHMDIISSDRKTVGKVDHLEGSDKIKLTRQSSPDGQHHHFIPVSWIDHIDQHVHLNKSGADVTAHWQHEKALTGRWPPRKTRQAACLRASFSRCYRSAAMLPFNEECRLSR